MTSLNSREIAIEMGHISLLARPADEPVRFNKRTDLFQPTLYLYLNELAGGMHERRRNIAIHVESFDTRGMKMGTAVTPSALFIIFIHQ